jgi:hypothetical protein
MKFISIANHHQHLAVLFVGSLLLGQGFVLGRVEGFAQGLYRLDAFQLQQGVELAIDEVEAFQPRVRRCAVGGLLEGKGKLVENGEEAAEEALVAVLEQVGPFRLHAVAIVHEVCLSPPEGVLKPTLLHFER